MNPSPIQTILNNRYRLSAYDFRQWYAEFAYNRTGTSTEDMLVHFDALHLPEQQPHSYAIVRNMLENVARNISPGVDTQFWSDYFANVELIADGITWGVGMADDNRFYGLFIAAFSSTSDVSAIADTFRGKA